MLNPLNEQEIRDRYALLCAACESDAQDKNMQLEARLQALEGIIERELPTLALKGSPDNFTELQHTLRLEMVRFREFCEYPELPQKIVVGLGGSFSSGKSSLINALIQDRKCLVTEVDPTTSLPTYLIHNDAEETDVRAINLFNRVVPLTHEQFRTLTHEEKLRYGSKVSGLLKSVVVRHPRLPWQNLALLDTPGYSKADEAGSERTDAGLARTQLNSAQFIVWLVPADKGTITEEDIAFLASLERDIPKLVVVSRADKHPAEDIARIVELVRETLQKRGIAALDVLPFTSRGKDRFPLEPILSHFNQWDQAKRELGFAEQFKRQFMAYQRFIDERHQQEQRMLGKFNRILALSDDSDVQDDVLSLQRKSKNELSNVESLKQDLMTLQVIFFTKLKQIGDVVGIPLPEPDAISLLDLPAINLSDMLSELAEKQNIDITEIDAAIWQPLMRDIPLTNLPTLLRRDMDFNVSTWAPLTKDLPLANLNKVLRHDVNYNSKVWEPLTQELPLANLEKLLRQEQRHYSALHTLQGNN